MVKKMDSVFQRIYAEGFCKYVFQHKETVAASKATFLTSENTLSGISELSNNDGTTRSEVFLKEDFDCVAPSGKVIPLQIIELACASGNVTEMGSVAKNGSVNVSN